jgi:hypothetical protein
VQELTTSLLLGRLLATKAYLQKITDPKLSKDKPISTRSTASKRTPHASHSNHPECSVGRGKNVAADLESIDI